MKPRGWTEDDDRRLKELWPYRTQIEIAAIMGTTNRTISRHVKLLGLSVADKSYIYYEKRSDIIRNVRKRDGAKPPAKPKDWKPDWTPERRAKLSKTRREMYQRERRRLLYNLPPITKIRVNLNGRLERKRRKQKQNNKS